MWVFGDECLDSDENCKHHSKYVVKNKKENHKSFTIIYGEEENDKVVCKEVTDDVKVSKNLVIKNQLFGAASKVGEEYPNSDGIMGKFLLFALTLCKYNR